MRVGTEVLRVDTVISVSPADFAALQPFKFRAPWPNRLGTARTSRGTLQVRRQRRMFHQSAANADEAPLITSPSAGIIFEEIPWPVAAMLADIFRFRARVNGSSPDSHQLVPASCSAVLTRSAVRVTGTHPLESSCL